MFSRRRVIPTQTIGAAITAGTAITTLVVSDVSFYEVGDKLSLAGEANNNEITITAITPATNTLTFASWTPAVGHADEDYIYPWVPDFTDDTEAVPGSLGTTQFGGSDHNMKSASVSLNNNLRYLEGEKTANVYPSRFTKGNTREATFSMEQFFSADLADFYTLADGTATRALDIPAGNEDGQIVTIRMPAVEVDQPTLDDAEDVNLTVTGQAFPTAADNDELALEFS